jgi:PAS domain S-box-containing protein
MRPASPLPTSPVGLDSGQLVELFDSLPIPFLVGRAGDRRVLAANQSFLDLIGYELDEILGATPPFPWWTGDADASVGFTSGSVVTRTYRCKDGRSLVVEVTSHGFADDLLLGIITDLTERRQLDQQLVQSGKLTAIGELAAGVAHEINNPLFAILGLTEFLLKESEEGTRAHHRLELIRETGLEIKEIVRALLDFAGETTEQRHTVRIEDVVRSTVELVRRTNAHKGVELVDTYDAGEAVVLASPNELKQVVLNLIANARQAMPFGGTIHVEVSCLGSHALVSVSDDGPGIEPALLSRIFEPFFTTKRDVGGTGLGLSVSLGIAESHGGTLIASSELGSGARFTLRLPLAGALR